MRKEVKIALVVLGIILLVGIIVGIFLNSNKRNYELNLPQQEKISSIVIKSNTNSAEVTDNEEIKDIIYVLSESGNGRTTKEESIQDYPVNSDNIVQVNFVFNESGKSTLLNMIGGLDRPSAGKLYVDGKNLFQMTENELVKYKRSTVGFVWQNNARNLLPYLTAWENVMTPMLFVEEKEKAVSEEEKKKRALELLELVGLGHRKDSKLSQLSGGEQQRVAIAIALANNPKLLLADEPTGAVDRKTADDILEMFRKLNEKLGLTIVIVTHDKELAKKVNRVVSIRDGKTSSERIMKNDYRERMEHLDIDWQEEETQEEFAVLDRAGRVQIPSELLEQMGMDGNKVKLEFIGGKIVIEKPKD